MTDLRACPPDPHWLSWTGPHDLRPVCDTALTSPAASLCRRRRPMPDLRARLTALVAEWRTTAARRRQRAHEQFTSADAAVREDAIRLEAYAGQLLAAADRLAALLREPPAGEEAPREQDYLRGYATALIDALAAISTIQPPPIVRLSPPTAQTAEE